MMFRNLFVEGVEADEDGVGRLTSYQLRGSGCGLQGAAQRLLIFD